MTTPDREPGRAAITTSTVITVDGLGLAVFERGEPEAPTIVLVHGYPDTSAVWNPVADLLASRFHVVTYDVRGAGASDAPATTAGYDLELLVADLASVLDAVSPSGPVHLVGHDWGSIQSWHAVTDPALASRFASFTSISGPGLAHVAHWLQARRTARPRDLGQLLRQGRRSWYVSAFQLPWIAPLAWRFGLAKAWPRMLATREHVQIGDGWPSSTLTDDAVRGVGLYRANMARYLSRRVVRRTDVPVQLIVPSADSFVTPALLDGIEEWAPRLWRRDVPAGHWLPRAKPVALALWVTELVDHLAGCRASGTASCPGSPADSPRSMSPQGSEGSARISS